MRSWRVVLQFAITLGLGMATVLPIAGSAGSLPDTQVSPLSQYLMADRSAEIALARSAAPASVSLHATALILTPHGYITAVQGTNGFTCLVERSWTSPFDATDFWSWKLRGPVCYNAPASRTVLRYTIFRATLAAAGVSKAQMLDRLQAAIENHYLPRAEPGSMAYMLSRKQYLGDAGKAWYPHLMLYAPKSSGANSGESWGANRPGSPVVFDSSHHIVPEPWTIFYVPVGRWSDGSAAPSM
ncbi:MAG: hypothetical protein JOZ77_03175 [Candidatus Eremiobacteraeota bacterium]|nr:hypothetical protein [Candidatus Eremiobacteraeota bacterium]